MSKGSKDSKNRNNLEASSFVEDTTLVYETISLEKTLIDNCNLEFGGNEAKRNSMRELVLSVAIEYGYVVFRKMLCHVRNLWLKLR